LRFSSEKDEKEERCWMFDKIELKNCKYDTAKGCLELNLADKSKNQEISNILLGLCDT